MPPTSASSLTTVARLAGVSVSTVSRALRGHSLLNVETIERVRRAAEQVNYQTNPIIADVMRRVRGGGRLRNLGTVAYLTFHDTVSGWRESRTYVAFYEGAVRRAEETGFKLELFWTRQPHLHSRRLTEILRSRGIVGVVVGPRPQQTPEVPLDWTHFSSAVVGVPLPGRPLHRAGSNQANNMETMLRALQARGYRRPGFVLQGPQVESSEHGWEAEWSYHQGRLKASQRVPYLGLKPRSQRTFARWFSRHRPDVVISLVDEFRPWLEQLGRRVPDDVGVACLARPAGPDGPAGVHQFPDAIGASAIDLVANQIFAHERGLPATPRSLLIDGQWRDGWTVR